jgi:hypothetical protein
MFGAWRGVMNDAPRYRLNAAECLLAARTCQPEYRRLFSAIAASWYSLAVQDETMDKLSVEWRAPGPAQETARVLQFRPAAKFARR